LHRGGCKNAPQKKSKYKKEDIYNKGANVKKRFTPPTMPEVQAHFEGLPKVTKQQAKEWAWAFWHFYDSKDWKVGSNKMQKWRSAASGWAGREMRRAGGPQVQMQNLTEKYRQNGKG
jgi:hypothetical protein